ncbi:hypothetical protein BaRGS_00018179 [Batillaria attramentaria]|uniref:Uncharacterized protein n=1 Tax=Batillaria attramentaria TaxID=370345 RepID=A0ABD0KU01_9CAEN
MEGYGEGEDYVRGMMTEWRTKTSKSLGSAPSEFSNTFRKLYSRGEMGWATHSAQIRPVLAFGNSSTTHTCEFTNSDLEIAKRFLCFHLFLLILRCSRPQNQRMSVSLQHPSRLSLCSDSKGGRVELSCSYEAI